MEDYKEKYDLALNKAKILLSKCKRVSDKASMIYRAEDIESIFPELQKPEEERIREEMLQIAKESEDSFYMVLTPSKRKMLINWLEKQASHTYTFEIKAGHWYKCVCDYMLNDSDLGYKNGNLYYCRRNWRLETEIEDEQNVKDIGVNGYKSFFRPATNQEIKDWLVKECDQKFSWGKEDEKKRILLMKILEVNHPHGLFKVNSSETMRTEELVSWLKSINYKI